VEEGQSRYLLLLCVVSSRQAHLLKKLLNTCSTHERDREKAGERGREKARERGREKARERGREKARERRLESEGEKRREGAKETAAPCVLQMRT
jgi:hypothetical protein